MKKSSFNAQPLQPLMATAAIVAIVLALGSPSSARAGSYIFAGDANGVNLVTHPTGYTGTETTVTVTVCIDPQSNNKAKMVKPIRHIVKTVNKLVPKTGNLISGSSNNIPSTSIDFESVALHEVVHCLGLGHVNASSESGLPSSEQNYTKATAGKNGVFNTKAGRDKVIGSCDDKRRDDQNLHWFRRSNNNPFTKAAIVDNTTYSRLKSKLPKSGCGGRKHKYAANGDRAVAALLLGSSDTEAVMNQGTFTDEAQRRLIHDDAATLEYAMSGTDEMAGNTDDYVLKLKYVGMTKSCDIVAKMQTQASLAFCSVGGVFIGTDHASITSATVNFSKDFNWFFNKRRWNKDN